MSGHMEMLRIDAAPSREVLLSEVHSALLTRDDLSHELGIMFAVCEQANRAIVTTHGDNAIAADLIGKIRQNGRAVEAVKTKIKAPAVAVLNAVDSMFRDLAVTRDEAERRLQRQMGAWAQRQAEEAAAKAAAEREAAAAEREAAAALAALEAPPSDAPDALADEPAPLPAELPPVAPTEPELVRTASATARTKTVRVFDAVADIAAIPSEFVKVDVAAINRALARGADVPGITCKEEVQVKVRAR